MEIYETVLILKPVLSDPEVAEYAEKTKQTISSEGGEIVSQEVWGRRKLTHMIGKAREGVYVYFKYKAAGALLKKLSHNFAISDSVIRNMTVVAQDRKMREKKAKVKKTPAAPAAAAAAAQE
jgi:small subunit ribosomal protein S6